MTYFLRFPRDYWLNLPSSRRLGDLLSRPGRRGLDFLVSVDWASRSSPSKSTCTLTSGRSILAQWIRHGQHRTQQNWKLAFNPITTGPRVPEFTVPQRFKVVMHFRPCTSLVHKVYLFWYCAYSSGRTDQRQIAGHAEHTSPARYKTPCSRSR